MRRILGRISDAFPCFGRASDQGHRDPPPRELNGRHRARETRPNDRDALRQSGCLSNGLAMVAPAGLEPATFGLGNRCSIRLSYGAALAAIVVACRRINPHRCNVAAMLHHRNPRSDLLDPVKINFREQQFLPLIAIHHHFTPWIDHQTMPERLPPIVMPPDCAPPPRTIPPRSLWREAGHANAPFRSAR